MTYGRLSPLERLIPDDAHLKVVKAKDRLRPMIQEAVKAECRLNLHHNDDLDNHNRKATVPVNIEIGLSPELKMLEIPQELLEVIYLSRYRHELEQVAASSRRLISMLERESTISLLNDAPKESVATTHAWSEWLSAKIQENDPIKFILNFDTDVLGCYRFHAGNTDSREVNRAGIVLYSGAIGAFSRILNCEIEDLTAVVLAHEYCHAYTQLGADIDGNRWPSAHYAAIEPALCEGLAQYYTDRALTRLDLKLPKALRVFQTTLEYQHPVYHSHRRWCNYSPEAVRRAMLETRTWNDRSLDQFEARLNEASKLFPANQNVRERSSRQNA